MVEQKTIILVLPIELRDDIVAHLDIKDILSFSLTCKRFRIILESRQTWMKLAQELQLQPQISKMEEPLDDFTTQELRDWTLRRHKIRHCFNSGSRAACHYIRGTDGAQKSVLLPGGRWLFFERSLGKIFYTDCDAPRPEVQSLITLESVVPGHFKTQFVVWRDPDSPRLNLRVAFMYWYNREDGKRDYQAYFCKIDLIGHSSSAKLVAERIHMYQGGFPSRETSGEAIRGEFFYQIHHVHGYGISPRLVNRHVTLEILNYGSGSSVVQQLRLVDFYYSLHRWRLDILPDGRIVVSGATGVVIYSNPLSIVGGEMKTLSPSLVIKGIGYTLRGGPVNMSEWYFSLSSSMAVYGASGKRVVAVWIPHDGTPLMKKTIEELMPNNTDRCVLGLFHCVALNSRDRMSILSYPWEDSEDQTGSVGMTGRTFTIEQDQDDGTYDVDGMDYAERDSGADEGVSDAWDVRYFSEELGRAIIRDWDRGYFVVDIVE